MKKLLIALVLLTGCVTKQEDKGIRKFVSAIGMLAENSDYPGTYFYIYDSVYVTLFRNGNFVIDTVLFTDEDLARKKSFADSLQKIDDRLKN